MATIMYHDHPYAGGLTEPVSADEVVYGDSNVEDELDKLNSVTRKMVECEQGLGFYWDGAALNVYINHTYMGYIKPQ